MTTLGNGSRPSTPTGMRVAPMSYLKIEEVAEAFRPLLPTIQGSNGFRIDAWRTLEITLPKAKYNYRSEEVSALKECAAFTIPDQGLVVLRQDVYDGLETENVFSRSTVIHEFSHIALKHSATWHRGAEPGKHQFCEDSEWQAKALTAALMMPLAACRAATSPYDLAQMCGTSVQAATFRLERLTKANIIPPKPKAGGLFDALK